MNLRRLGLIGVLLSMSACGDDGGAGATDGSSSSATLDPSTSPSTTEAMLTSGTAASTTEASESSTTSASTGETETDTPVDYPPLDILFVVDDAADMTSINHGFGLHQLLGATLWTYDIDFRFAAISADAAHPACPDVVDEDVGAFVTQSCRARLDEFEFDGDPYPTISGCTSHCSVDEIDLEGRAWATPQDAIARYDNSRSLSELVACLGVVGRDGCPYAQPLEAMARAIERTGDPNADEFGFIRPEANLLIVIVSDDADCSVADPSIFAPDGLRTFWGDPTAEAPTPAVCWNAGVSCSGDPSGYDDCEAANLAADGTPTDPGNAVLHPVDRYVDIIDGLRETKTEHGTNVYVFTVAGFAADNDSVTYANDGNDPAFEAEHGIGRGCSEIGTAPQYPRDAVPPVRLREFSERVVTTLDGYPWAPTTSVCNPFLNYDDVVERLYTY